MWCKRRKAYAQDIYDRGTHIIKRTLISNNVPTIVWENGSSSLSLYHMHKHIHRTSFMFVAGFLFSHFKCVYRIGTGLFHIYIYIRMYNTSPPPESGGSSSTFSHSFFILIRHIHTRSKSRKSFSFRWRWCYFFFCCHFECFFFEWLWVFFFFAATFREKSFCCCYFRLHTYNSLSACVRDALLYLL